MNRSRSSLMTWILVLSAAAVLAKESVETRKFEWTTRSSEAKELLGELQSRIENFEAGAEVTALARRLVEADPGFAMGEYYLSAVTPPDEAQRHLDKAVELARNASEGERRFIEAMVVVRANQSANFQDGIPLLDALAKDYPGERLVYMILGQIHQGANDSVKARAAFEKALEVGPESARARAFLANDDLMRGKYSEARASFESVERGLPRDAVPFVIRYGVAFSHLYEGNPAPAVESLTTYVSEYKESGANQAFPEVFIWNSIARIYLENGQPERAMEAYDKGYASVPGSGIPEDQKQVWLGRLHHGTCRALAKLGRYEEASAEAEKVRKMIEEGGEAAEQYLPAYHYLVGYLKLEQGEIDRAIEHLEQSNPDDPFHRLLLGRAYERKGNKEGARAAYERVVASTANSLERALAYPEAKQHLATL